MSETSAPSSYITSERYHERWHVYLPPRALSLLSDAPVLLALLALMEKRIDILRRNVVCQTRPWDTVWTVRHL